MLIEELNAEIAMWKSRFQAAQAQITNMRMQKANSV